MKAAFYFGFLILLGILFYGVANADTICDQRGDSVKCRDRNHYTAEFSSGEPLKNSESSLAVSLLRDGDPNDCRLYQGNMPPTRSWELKRRYDRCRVRQ